MLLVVSLASSASDHRDAESVQLSRVPDHGARCSLGFCWRLDWSWDSTRLMMSGPLLGGGGGCIQWETTGLLFWRLPFRLAPPRRILLPPPTEAAHPRLAGDSSQRNLAYASSPDGRWVCACTWEEALASGHECGVHEVDDAGVTARLLLPVLPADVDA